MKTVLIMRHAKSSWDKAFTADHDRPLKKRGKHDSPRMGRLIREQDLVPDLIITSSAKRAVATAEAVALACGYEHEIEVTREFYHAGVDAYIDWLQSLPDHCHRVLIVGHNPGMEELLEELTGTWQRMPTAALAEVRFPLTFWSGLDEMTVGEMKNLWLPRNLP
jgi:phosphohistidine phosphatase